MMITLMGKEKRKKKGLNIKDQSCEVKIDKHMMQIV